MKAPEVTPVESSNIAGINFTPYDLHGEDDHGFGVLTVKFNNGTYYKYENVTDLIGREIFEAESVGRYFNRVVRPVYLGVKMEIDDEEA